jgi:hypothetical protein
MAYSDRLLIPCPLRQVRFVRALPSEHRLQAGRMGVAKVIVPSPALEVLKFNAGLWRTEANSTAGFVSALTAILTHVID